MKTTVQPQKDSSQQASSYSIIPQSDSVIQCEPELQPSLAIQMSRATEFGHSVTGVPVQAELVVGEPGDKYEQEADSVAAQAVADKHHSEQSTVQAKTNPTAPTTLPDQPNNLETQLAADLPDVAGGGEKAPEIDGGGEKAPEIPGGGEKPPEMAGEGEKAPEALGEKGGLAEAAEGGTGGAGGAAEGGAEATPPPKKEGEAPSEEQKDMMGETFSPETQDQMGEALGEEQKPTGGTEGGETGTGEAGEQPPSLEERIQKAMGGGGGSPTPEEQESLRNYLGIEDPENIQVHDDEESYQLCRELGALAFTTENHIFFGAGQRGDDELLFHEAWHTVQQGATSLEVRPGGEKAAEDEKTQPITVGGEGEAMMTMAQVNPQALSGLLVQREEGEKTATDKEAEEKQKEQAGAQADNAKEQGSEQGEAVEEGADSAEKDGGGEAQDAVGETSGMVAEAGPEETLGGIPDAPTLNPEAMIPSSGIPTDGETAEANLDELEDEVDVPEPGEDPFDYSWVATQPNEVPEWDEEVGNYSFFKSVLDGGEPEAPQPEVDRGELIGDAIGQGLLTGAVEGGISGVTALGVGAIGNKLPVVNNALATFTVLSAVGNSEEGWASPEAWANALAGGSWADDAKGIGEAAGGILNAKTPWEGIANYFKGIIGITNLVVKVVQFVWNLVNIAALICGIIWGVLTVLDILFTAIGKLLALVGTALISVGNALMPLPFGVGIPPGTSLISVGTTLVNVGNQLWMYALTVFKPWATTFKGFFDTLNGFLSPLSIALTMLQSLLVCLNLMYMQALALDILTCEGSIDDLIAKQTALRDSTQSMTGNAIAIGTEFAAQKTQKKDVGAEKSFASGGENAWLGQIPVVSDYMPGGDKSLGGMAGAAATGFAIGAESGETDEETAQNEQKYQDSWLANYSKNPDQDQQALTGYRSAAALYEALGGAGEMPEPPMDAPERVDAAAFGMVKNEGERLALEAAIQRAEEEKALLQENVAGNQAAQDSLAANREAIATYQADIAERQAVNDTLGAEAGMGTALAAQYLGVMAAYWPILIPINIAFAFVIAIQGANQNVKETGGNNAVNTEGSSASNPETNVSGNADGQQKAGENMGNASEASGELAEERISQLDSASAEAEQHDAEMEAMQAQFEEQQLASEEDLATLDEGQVLAEEEQSNSESNRDQLMADREAAIAEAQVWEEEFSTFFTGIMETLGWSDGEEEATTPDESGSGLDLSGADLSGTDMTGANLNGANLEGADLSGVTLVDAELAGANLAGANLARADLSNADLSDVDFSHALLMGAKLVHSLLGSADFQDADLTDADLKDTELEEAQLNG
ncbi:pentapeptide repeat-containing protein [Spirulina subsalsa FACHB-351]|uniref:Pentapeptide repeat-containing protein n=1 Tax=Spirulina subsalsa FACHB-351 TaxID=234711 RepID=A0ABT3L510_9CYAN|nr:pentapeptide repeat-containing protein [Spirulina subsalsa]MCW6036070.1 pentapeptide repeat-containing protein [Spirulina subsalsa FACHB-351]